jgi:diguanylate cyclase (GGDEF)-like protein
VHFVPHISALATFSSQDRQGATRAVAYFMLAGAVVLGVLNALVPGYGASDLRGNLASYGTATVLGLLGLVCWKLPDRIPVAFWVCVPVVAVPVVGCLEYLGSEAGAGAQPFFLWPVLYAAAFLRRALTYVVLLSVAATNFALISTLETVSSALGHTTALMVSLAMASTIIWALRSRVDKLLSVLETQALSDQLTGLANRRAFDRDLTHAVAKARRNGQPLSLLTIDLDLFKEINDTWGHAIGDQALQSLALALRTTCRESDFVARLGGDEFVILLPDCDTPGAQRVAGALQAAVRRIPPLPCEAPTVSIGAATMPHDAKTEADLVAASDAALYAAKLAGRNQIVCASAV